MKCFNIIGITVAFLFSLLLLSNCGSNFEYNQEVQYDNPSWAPTYYSGVRYYYIPDIEVYYDLSGQEFVYLDNGQWLFSHSLPSYYSGFDLDNCFVITLNHSVYQPWMHHHYYISHYPRYYYRNTYREEERSRIRGFNENEGKPIYHRQEVRPRINEPRNEEKVERKPEFSREPQKTNYYGREIGRPVRVRPEMKENKTSIKRIDIKQIKRQDTKPIIKDAHPR